VDVLRVRALLPFVMHVCLQLVGLLLEKGADATAKVREFMLEFAAFCRRFILPSVDALLKDSDGNSSLVACVQGESVTRCSVRQHRAIFIS
jgi:hypothetical protein